mmetsp:Transcript_12828/g.47968  ORF Transcript_12828/g.47968 Transcript_12828/m.47968 type:complete len:214 (-) Transcript_12828:210-851(-)
MDTAFPSTKCIWTYGSLSIPMASQRDGASSFRTRRKSTCANSLDAIFVSLGCSALHAKHHPAKNSTTISFFFPSVFDWTFASTNLCMNSRLLRASATLGNEPPLCHHGATASPVGRRTSFCVDSSPRVSACLVSISISNSSKSSFSVSVFRSDASFFFAPLEPTDCPTVPRAAAAFALSEARVMPSCRVEGVEEDEDAVVVVRQPVVRTENSV